MFPLISCIIAGFSPCCIELMQQICDKVSSIYLQIICASISKHDVLLPPPTPLENGGKAVKAPTLGGKESE